MVNPPSLRQPPAPVDHVSRLRQVWGRINAGQRKLDTSPRSAESAPDSLTSWKATHGPPACPAFQMRAVNRHTIHSNYA